MKVQQDSTAKKSKANEQRLYDLLKEHDKHAEQVEAQLVQAEEDKLGK